MSAPVRWTPRARILGNLAGLLSLLTLGGLLGAVAYLNFLDAAIERGAL